jgi:hypothetical protein
MNNGPWEKIISILSGHGFEVKKYLSPDSIKKPGFYFNEKSFQIEHWSKECGYNRVMALYNQKNKSGLIQDGWQSVLHFEDVDRLIQSIKVWDNHLTKYGVK